ASTLSRSVAFLHLVPYVISLIEMHGWTQILNSKRRMAGAAAVVLALVAIVACVQVLRAQSFYGSPEVKSNFMRLAPAAPGELPSTTEARYAAYVRHTMIAEIPLLVTQRWVGLDAVL